MSRFSPPDFAPQDSECNVQEAAAVAREHELRLLRARSEIMEAIVTGRETIATSRILLARVDLILAKRYLL